MVVITIIERLYFCFLDSSCCLSASFTANLYCVFQSMNGAHTIGIIGDLIGFDLGRLANNDAP